MDNFQNNPTPAFSNVPNDAATFGNLPQGSEGFGNVQNDSEDFRKVPQPLGAFRTIRKGSEKTEHHTLTVREATRLFEQAGVPRTERSIVNWCQHNPQGIARLDAFYDMSERRYFITAQSVDLAIREEQAKRSASGNAPAATPTSAPEPETRRSETPPPRSEDSDTAKELERKIRDLESRHGRKTTSSKGSKPIAPRQWINSSA